MPSRPTPAEIPPTRGAFALQVISLAGVCWEDCVREASVPGAAGRLGIMAGHLPLLAPLMDGIVRLFPAEMNSAIEFHVSRGYVEVQPDRVIILAELAARSPSRDAARAEEARQRVESPMANACSDDNNPALHAALMARLARVRKPGR